MGREEGRIAIFLLLLLLFFFFVINQSFARRASPAFSFGLFYTLSDVYLQHLFN